EALRFAEHRVIGHSRESIGIYVRSVIRADVRVRGDRCQALADAVRVDNFETFAMLKHARDGRFARARKPAYHDQSRRRAIRIAPRKLEVITRELAGALALRRADFALQAPQTLDLAAHACAIALVERDEHRKLFVAGDLGVGLDQLLGEPRRTEPLEVHRQECNLRSDVAIAQLLAELDAI